MKKSQLLGTLLLISLLALTACESTSPKQDGDGPVDLAGSFDPDGDGFTLKTLDLSTPGGATARVALVAKNLDVDPDASTVSIDVAIHNLSERSLFPQLIVWLDDFHPDGVTPQNADLLPPTDVNLPASGPWGYRYDELVGEDGELQSGDVSEFSTWVFYDPDLLPFRFAARLDFAVEPGAARLAGVIFNDEDLDGERDPEESLWGEGHVFVEVPSGESHLVAVAGDGHYAVRIKEPGLYTALYLPPPTFGFAPLYMTTPNPLEILITPGPDGGATDFLDANFGLAAGEAFPRPVQFSELSPAELPSDPFELIEIGIRGRLLVAALAFGGCTAEHPIDLVMSGGFELDASGLASAELVLVHDDLDEPCDAWFQVRRPFDLMPLIVRYREEFGRWDPVLLRIHLANGQVEELLLAGETDRNGP